MEKTSTVLVTGSAGYLGNHLVKTFSKAGWKVIGFDNRQPSYPANEYLYDYCVGDIRNLDELERVFKWYDSDFDLIIHLAGRIEAGISFSEPAEFYSVNTGGTCNLLSMMVKNGCKNIIFSSTAAVYETQNRPITENDPTTNNSPYGYSKFCAECAIKDSGLNHIIFRYFNLTGADADGEMGECHEPETHFIPKLIGTLNKPESSIEIFGNDYNTPDGTCVRDYVHVTDIAEAHLNAAEYLLSGNKSAVLNLGTGRGYSILEVLDELERVTNSVINYSFKPRRNGDAQSLIADISEAKKLIGYEPKYDLADILKTAYNWHTK